MLGYTVGCLLWSSHCGFHSSAATLSGCEWEKERCHSLSLFLPQRRGVEECEDLSWCSCCDSVQRKAAKLSMDYLGIYSAYSWSALHRQDNMVNTLKLNRKCRKKEENQLKWTVCDIVCVWFTRVWLFQQHCHHWTLTSGAVCRLTMFYDSHYSVWPGITFILNVSVPSSVNPKCVYV